MRRSNASPADEPARGNFTPPQRAGTSPVDVPVDPPAKNGSTSRFAPRNWRVPTKLNAILLVPVLVGLVMGGFQVKGSVDSWNEAKDAEKTARIVQAAAEYGQALLDERDLTAEPLLRGDKNNEAVAKAYAATDAAKAKFAAAAKNLPENQGLERRLELFRQEEPKLAAVRATAYVAPETEKKNPPSANGPIPTEEGYVLVQHYLMTFSNELGLGTGNVTSYGRMVYAVELAKAANSLQRSVGTHLLVRPNENEQVRKAQLVAFSSYAYLEDIAIGEYVAAGTEDDVNRLKEVMGKKSQEGAAKLALAKQQAEQAGTVFKTPPMVNNSALTGMTDAIAGGDSKAKLAAGGTTPQAWQAAATAKFDGYAEIEKELLDKAVTDSVAVSDSARNDAIWTGAIVVVALLAAFILAGMMARSMSRSMRRLRTAAFDVAEQRLPMLVDQLSRTDPGKVDTRVAPIPIDSQDEIGEVARAFDQVHREAVRLAAEQALLRGNVNAIFTNLSIRNQSLIEGQLTLITDLENNEADPDQLENLFRLDHLATRMRRNGENLLILAGEEPGRRWDQPVPLVDVLRAASSEVEQYERIELSGVSEAEIHGQAVTDLVHLLAELLENATTFSSPQTKVRVNATRLPDGRVMVEIHDKGIGLTAEDFADINHKLANPPTVDAAISQRMGLFVVGRLADRHSIRVQLRPSGEAAGTTSLVMLPDAITHGGGGEGIPDDDFTVSSMIPQQQTQQAVPMRTAAELGFDDSQYEGRGADQQGGDGLDSVGRSLAHQDRRAALEAQVGYGQEQQRGEYAEQEYAEPQPEHGYQQYQEYEQQPEGGYDTSYDSRQAHGAQQGYDAYPQQDFGYPEASYQDRQQGAPAYEDGYASQSQQAEWPEQNTYSGGYQQGYGTESEPPVAPEPVADRVGFDRPGAAADTGHEVTGAGLPRRGSQQQWQPARKEAESTGSLFEQRPQRQQQPAAPERDEEGGDAWRSNNDERWQQASKLREPKAGGVTPSGLPRRVPKANLVEGAAETTPQGGPQVSRAPEDVRGRLSNLRRGVQQGRSAGSEQSSNSYDQER
ncbi:MULTISPECIES: nitrate- and nitrite sensing domain-containing protein [unclassified Streptomyces]|uniref:sensor histidine kinase n=1 Tax=unclassified Streptomyces TaxID=2593676 RepID=UPI002E10AE53|nr:MULTISPECIES: nitrate- and nitrite sensing domain-containing protein [unclassified Streptomyces]WSR21315.1 nitrate- and nitrite sensing domain-containing protein [Streptomyces sp. NBC_01205]